MRFRNYDLLIVMLLVILNVVWTQVPTHVPAISILLGLPLSLFLPGYSFTQMLFRRREQQQDDSNSIIQRPELKIGHPVGGADLIVLSLGLSMGIDVLVGFGLNILPIGLQGLSWVLSLGLITMVFAVIATILRSRDILYFTRSRHIRITFQDCLLFTLALLIAASAVWISVIRPLNPQPSFTQLSMLPTNQASKVCEVSIRVQSYEVSQETYRLVLMVNKAQANTWSSIVLTPQQLWVQSVTLTPGATSNLYIEAQLYRSEQPAMLYRNVHLTFYVSSGSGAVQKQCVMQ